MFAVLSRWFYVTSCLLIWARGREVWDDPMTWDTGRPLIYLVLGAVCHVLAEERK